MSRNKHSSFRTAERVWKTLFKANVTVLLLVCRNNVTISRLNQIGRQLQPVERAAGKLAVNWQTTLAWCRLSFRPVCDVSTDHRRPRRSVCQYKHGQNGMSR